MDLLSKMAPTRANFFIPSPRIFLCATFIMLSGTVTAERQCYWCGPLAEQVHRSRRAPSCDTPTKHVTTCEPGLTHCAVIATSPPHIESRFCVKLYQDECYPLFCNSTKTWKMTCPCRGDLCNGNNTERENEAFAVLSKLVAKTLNIRIKKRSSSSNFTLSTREHTIVITNETDMEVNVTDNNDQINDFDQMIVVTGITQEDSFKANNTVNMTPAQSLDEDDISDNSINDISTTKSSKENNTSELVITVEPNIGNLSTKNVETIAPIATMATKTELVKESLAHNFIIKPSEQLPTAEALQQNVSPSVKSLKTTESLKTDLSTLVIEESTTAKPTKAGENYAGQLSANIFTLLIFILTISPLY
ncbi:unnamed protein product [Parnassius apollo]|uniref:(apollo) hypothetical protein n=1 Tax=Parnassius apollo TaxID=110799 RepID=A0A8S3WYJ9_PARAO|nr:unnamed protein product [Parnassius apollo]